MIRLSMLGQIQLCDARGGELTAVLRQSKRLAILAYLASAQPSTSVRRERLISMFWRDLPEDRARNALRQALHKLRAALGAEVIVAQGPDSLRIDDACLECDLWQFNAALRLGDLPQALERYRGLLLPDLLVPDAPEFNEWLDTQRADVQRAAARAAWALAERYERAGRQDDAGVEARRAIELLEGDEPALRQLLMLLDRIHDSAGAISAYQLYEARLRARLDMELSAETKALVQRIRDGHDLPSGRSLPPAAGNASTRARIVVRGFDNLNRTVEHDPVGALATNACRQALQKIRLVDVVEQEAGVALAICGDYHLADHRWHVRAFVQTVGDSRAVGTGVRAEAARDRPWDAANDVAERVAAIVAAHLDPRVASWAAAVNEPPTLEAHELHLRGMGEHLRGDFRAAVASFAGAASLKQRYSVPLLWAIQACLNIEEYEQAAALHEGLASQHGHLSRAEQLGCDYFGALLAGDRGTAFRALVRVAELVPDSEVLSQLGLQAMFINRPRLAVETLQRLGPDRGWMPEWTPYWRRLTEALHMTGDHTTERDAAEQGRRQHPESVGVLLYAARANAALGDVQAVRAAVETAVAMERDRFTTSADVAYVAATELRSHGAPEEGRSLLHLAIALQREASGGVDCEDRERVRLAQLLYEDAELDQALGVLATCTVRDATEVTGLEGRIHARAGQSGAAQRAVATLEAMPRRFRFGRHLLEAARIAAILHEEERAVTLLRSAFARGLPYSVELHADIDLALLSHYAGARDLLRPKG